MQWTANLNRRLAFRRPEFTPTRKSPLTEYAAIVLFYSIGHVIKNQTSSQNSDGVTPCGALNTGGV